MAFSLSGPKGTTAAEPPERGATLFASPPVNCRRAEVSHFWDRCHTFRKKCPVFGTVNEGGDKVEDFTHRTTVAVTTTDAWADDLDIIEALAQSILDQVAEIRADRREVNG